MDIRQNQELFKNVIKDTAGAEQKKSSLKNMQIGLQNGKTQDDIFVETQIAAIKAKVNKKTTLSKDPNRSEYMDFMLSNINHTSTKRKLNHDMT